MTTGFFKRLITRAFVAGILIFPLLARPAAAQTCLCDCGNRGQVTTEDLVAAVYIALGQLPADSCPQADSTGNGITVDELVQCVENSLKGCGPTPTPGGPTFTPAPTRTPTVGPGCGNNVVEGDEQCDGTALGSCPEGAGCFPPGDPNECQCKPASCGAIDANSGGANTQGTFTVKSLGAPQNGQKYCGGLSDSTCASDSTKLCTFGDDLCTAPDTCIHHAFTPCESDADCGGTANQCQPIPWLGVSNFAPFPITSVETTFTAGPPDAKCVHEATVPCVGSVDPCPAQTKLGVGHPCCQTPGFKVDTFFIAALGFCSRVDQTACGGGVVDTSVPMLGDNDVTKVADTSTPLGPNCTYNGSPGETHADCGAVEDALGQITTTIGDGVADAAGGHTRFSIPQRSVTWIETSAPPCAPTSTFDPTDGQVSVFNLNLATTTASSTASFLDVNGDGQNYCGFGPDHFYNTATGKPDLPGQGSLTVAVGAAFSGGGPTYDLLFSSITPLTSPSKVADIAMCTPPPPGCPE